MKPEVTFFGVLYDVRMKRDGGGRVQIDFGGDAFEEVVDLMRYFKENAVSVAICLAPYSESNQDQSDQTNQLGIEEYLGKTPEPSIETGRSLPDSIRKRALEALEANSPDKTPNPGLDDLRDE